MERKFGIYIVLGLAMGVIFGLGVGAANGNTPYGVGLGALFGTYIGWFVAAVAVERQNKKRQGK